MQYIFVLNPAAGHEDSTLVLKDHIREVFGEQAVIHITAGVGDASAFVREYAEQHPTEQLRFYACGGDGTFSEVVGGAVGFDHVAVGLFPTGSGNDFVRNFTNGEGFLSAQKQREGEEIAIDLLRCNDRYCVNMLNIGFDCEVVAKVQEIKRRVPAGMAYALGVLIELIKKPCAKLKVIADGALFGEGERLLCAVGNGSYYGGGYHPLPHARLDDGLIDACLVNNVSRIKFVSLIGRYKKGTHIVPETANVIKLVRCKKLSIEFPATQSVCIDGELVNMDRCDIELLPSALRLIVPKGSALAETPAAQGSNA